jgi:hypothetical protein
MTANLLKSKAPDLSANPEEYVSPEVNDKPPGSGAVPQNRNQHLQEKLLSGGNHTALLDNEDRMGRRPSVGSLNVDGSSVVSQETDDGGYYNMTRVLPRLVRADMISVS